MKACSFGLFCECRLADGLNMLMERDSLDEGHGFSCTVKAGAFEGFSPWGTVLQSFNVHPRSFRWDGNVLCDQRDLPSPPSVSGCNKRRTLSRDAATLPPRGPLQVAC